jgi:anion-transporting  ArsA/GET3 family ATPase
MTAGFSMITGALTKVLGATFLRDVQTFVGAIDTLFGGFRLRAQQTFRLLQADGTAFIVVAAPEPDALREAAYFVERLSEDGMPLAGLVVNRAATAQSSDLSAEEAAAAAGRLAKDPGSKDPGSKDPGSLAAGLLRLYADRSRLVEREAGLRARFAAAHPEVPTAVVPALAGDVHDLVDLRRVGVLLGGQDGDTRVETG